jgi:hypothetical protein
MMTKQVKRRKSKNRRKTRKTWRTGGDNNNNFLANSETIVSEFKANYDDFYLLHMLTSEEHRELACKLLQIDWNIDGSHYDTLEKAIKSSNHACKTKLLYFLIELKIACDEISEAEKKIARRNLSSDANEREKLRLNTNIAKKGQFITFINNCFILFISSILIRQKSKKNNCQMILD